MQLSPLSYQNMHMSWISCLPVCFVRAVRGAVGHGDAGRAAGRHQRRHYLPGACVQPVCCAHRLHPAGDGGPLCLSSCHTAALVSNPALVVLSAK